jgi:inner membrane protein
MNNDASTFPNGSANTPPSLPASAHGIMQTYRKRSGTVLKMLAIFVLVLLLLIPLHMINSVLSERLERRNEAISNITSTWGTEQIIAGPVLVVPYKYQFKTWKDQTINGRVEKTEVTETSVAHASFLPSDLQITGKLDPSILHRGIYNTIVYRGALKINGAFTKPSFDEWKVKPEDVLWEDATLAFGITDLRGANGALTLKWDEQSIPLNPGVKFLGVSSGVHARIGATAFSADTAKFELPLLLNGSRSISFAPMGTQNEVKLTSTWPAPSFQGAFLPVERKVSATGFEALWQVSYYGRSYPQQWSSQDGKDPLQADSLRSSLFGVDLISVVDSYRYVERSIKYGILFIALIYTAFFLFEALTPIRIHPFQYTIVGVALCLFYLALLSLSEIIDFGFAYLTGATAATLMITFYSSSVLKNSWRALAIAAELGAIYGFLYVILQQQDYSLLFGTVGLFIVIAVVMYATRNIDWYARDGR